MAIEKVTLPNLNAKESLSLSDYDCVWVRFTKNGHSVLHKSRTLQWIDWRLQGQVSRFFAHSEFKKPTITFLATLTRLPVPFLALQSNEVKDFETFLNNCRGLKLKNVLLFSEDSGDVSEVESGLAKVQAHDFPIQVVLGCDSD